MKAKRNRLQHAVLKRLEAGLPPTRWHQFRLHLQTAWRHRHKLNLQRTLYHLRGIWGLIFIGNRKK
jgi:hypothetical protein